jgi:DEAD/DEAH box helicase domain-containing protein
LSERLFKRHEELVAGARALIEACSCDAGCPACTGPRLDPEVNGKQLALRLLALLDGRTAIDAGGPPADAKVPA